MAPVKAPIAALEALADVVTAHIAAVAIKMSSLIAHIHPFEPTRQLTESGGMTSLERFSQCKQ